VKEGGIELGEWPEVWSQVEERNHNPHSIAPSPAIPLAHQAREEVMS